MILSKHYGSTLFSILGSTIFAVALLTGCSVTKEEITQGTPTGSPSAGSSQSSSPSSDPNLPDGWPNDVPVVAGSIVSSDENSDEHKFTITVRPSAPAGLTAAKDQLVAAGYTVNEENLPLGNGLSAKGPQYKVEIVDRDNNLVYEVKPVS
jgi:hypothetical protein